jgi:hypothetical protein
MTTGTYKMLPKSSVVGRPPSQLCELSSHRWQNDDSSLHTVPNEKGFRTEKPGSKPGTLPRKIRQAQVNLEGNLKNLHQNREGNLKVGDAPLRRRRASHLLIGNVVIAKVC